MNEKGFVLLSKLQLPEINPRTLHRSRLINLLYQNIHKKFIFMCAGAGYGKTTLLTQFISEVKISYVYYQLRKEDSDPSVFLSHLIGGIKSIYPEFGKNIDKLSQFFNLQPGMEGIVLGTFINEVVQTINNDTYLIFDDYHTLEISSAIDGIISYLLENMPKRLHIIICSRMNLSFPLAKLKSKDEVFEINTDLLRFTKEEIQALFTTFFNIKPNLEQIEWLYKHSEGWPAFLRLILQSYDLATPEQRASFFAKMQENYKKIADDIFDYFALEIFKNETEENQNFLIDCSLLEYLSPEICRVITRRNDCQKILEELSRKNAFVFSLPDGNFRLHSLYRDFLKNRFLNDDRKKEIYNLIAEYHKKKNAEESLKYYLQAENFSGAIKIIEDVAKKMLEQGRYTTLVSSIEKLPAELVNNNPKVLQFYAEALSFLGNQIKAKEILNKALKLSKNMAELKSEIIYSLSGVFINEGILNLAIKLLARLIKICPKNLDLLKASALNSLGAIYNAMGGKRFFQAKTLFREAFRIAERNRYQELKTSILNNWAMNEIKSGNIANAYEKIILAVNLLKDHFSLGCGAGFYNGARISLLLGHKDVAEKVLEIGLNTCKPFNDPWSMANIYRGYGLLYIEKDELKKAKEFFTRALEIYEMIKIPWLIVATLIELCRLEVLDENFTEAETILNRIKELKKTVDAETIHILSIDAQLKIAQNEYTKAKDILKEAAKLSRKYNLPLEGFLINLKLCSVLQKQEKKKKAVGILKKLIIYAERKGYDFLLIKELKKEPEMVDLIIRGRINLNYIYSSLKKYKTFNIINVSFFGSPTLEINGKKLQGYEWKTEKTKKLFFYLLLNKNKEISQEKLIDIFWHKAGLKKGYDSLRKAVYHIRKTLKNYGVEEPILVRTGNYQLSPNLFIYSDIDEIDVLIREYKRKGHLDKKETQRFFDLYKNGF
ncbi:MAG: hypothetical protein ACPL28_03175, partial [bacterium]